MLGCVYIKALPPDFRASHGVFYTPPEIVRHTLDMAERAGIDWRRARCLDPSAGGGAFNEIIRRIRDNLAAPPAFILSQIANRVRGYDLDPFGAWLAQLAAYRRARPRNCCHPICPRSSPSDMTVWGASWKIATVLILYPATSFGRFRCRRAPGVLRPQHLRAHQPLWSVRRRGPSFAGRMGSSPICNADFDALPAFITNCSCSVGKRSAAARDHFRYAAFGDLRGLRCRTMLGDLPEGPFVKWRRSSLPSRLAGCASTGLCAIDPYRLQRVPPATTVPPGYSPRTANQTALAARLPQHEFSASKLRLHGFHWSTGRGTGPSPGANPRPRPTPCRWCGPNPLQVTALPRRANQHDDSAGSARSSPRTIGS